MSTKTVTEYVMCELVNVDNPKKTYTPKLKLSVNEFTPDGELSPVKRWLIGHELTPMSSMVIEDGTYTLRYAFAGQQQEQTVKIQGGSMLAA